MVPFAAAGSAFANDDSVSVSGVSDETIIIPAGAVDYVFDSDERQTFGVEVHALSSALATVNVDGDQNFLGVFVNPRYEYGFSEYASLTIDGNFGYLTDGDNGAPFIAPTFGIRTYLPIGFGGFILSQQIGTAGITVTLPGSLAIDIPIPLGKNAAVHIFPEIRWDPTFLLISDASGVIALFSAGATIMFEL